MRKLPGAVFLSLDGVMQAPGRPEEIPSGGIKYGGWTAACGRQQRRENMAVDAG